MYDVEKSIAQADENFKDLVSYVRGEAQNEEAHVVEKRLFQGGGFSRVPNRSSG